MLFDLTSPGRRRVVRVVFGALAVVFAISFVFLGVGSGTGGLSFSDLFGGGGNDPSAAFNDDIKAEEAKLVVNPQDTAALAQLVQLHYSAGVQSVDSNGNVSSNGEQQLQESADSWNKYLKATKQQPAKGPTLIAVQTFDALGKITFGQARTATTTGEALTAANTAVANWEAAARAQQFLVDKQLTSANYQRLAFYQYLAGDDTGGDESVAKAKQVAKGTQAAGIDQSLAPYKKLGQQLKAAIKQLTKQQQQQSQSVTGGGSNPLGGVGGSASLGG